MIKTTCTGTAHFPVFRSAMLLRRSCHNRDAVALNRWEEASSIWPQEIFCLTKYFTSRNVIWGWSVPKTMIKMFTKRQSGGAIGCRRWWRRKKKFPEQKVFEELGSKQQGRARLVNIIVIVSWLDNSNIIIILLLILLYIITIIIIIIILPILISRHRDEASAKFPHRPEGRQRLLARQSEKVSLDDHHWWSRWWWLLWQLLWWRWWYWLKLWRCSYQNELSLLKWTPISGIENAAY